MISSQLVTLAELTGVDADQNSLEKLLAVDPPIYYLIPTNEDIEKEVYLITTKTFQASCTLT